jgi:hypothetical protein
MNERDDLDMTSDPNDTRPTWTTDPAPTTQASVTPAPVTPAPAAIPPTAPAAPASPSAAVNPVSPATVTPRRGGGAWVNLLLVGAAVIAVGGVAFAIGRTTAPAAASTVGTFQRGGNLPGGVALDPNGSFDPGAGNGGRFGGGSGAFGNGGLAIDGTVTAVDGSTLTITTANGGSVTFDTDDQTTYHETTETDAGSVGVGDDVTVRLNGGGFLRGNGNGIGNGNAANPTAGDVSIAQ